MYQGESNMAYERICLDISRILNVARSSCGSKSRGWRSPSEEVAVVDSRNKFMGVTTRTRLIEGVLG